MPDTIEINGIDTVAHVGVPDEERALPQRLRVSVLLTPRRDFTALEDAIEQTIDYQEVTGAIRAVAAEKPRRLIETLAHELAQALLARYPLVGVSVLVEKFILPGVESVGVRVQRSAVPPLGYSI